MKLMTMLLGITLLSAPAMFGATKKGGKVVEKNPEAAKAAKAAKAAQPEKAQKAKTQSAADKAQK